MTRGFEQKWNANDYLQMHRSRLQTIVTAIGTLAANENIGFAAEFVAAPEAAPLSAMTIVRGGCSLENARQVFVRHGHQDEQAQRATVDLINRHMMAAAWDQTITAWYHARHALALPDDAGFGSGEVISIEAEGPLVDYTAAAVRFTSVPELGELEVYSFTRITDDRVADDDRATDLYVMQSAGQVLAVATSNIDLPPSGELQSIIDDLQSSQSL